MCSELRRHGRSRSSGGRVRARRLHVSGSGRVRPAREPVTRESVRAASPASAQHRMTRHVLPRGESSSVGTSSTTLTQKRNLSQSWTCDGGFTDRPNTSVRRTGATPLRELCRRQPAARAGARRLSPRLALFPGNPPCRNRLLDQGHAGQYVSRGGSASSRARVT